MPAVDLIGFAHTRFGKFPERDVESLMREVAKQAIDDTGLDLPDGIDPETFTRLTIAVFEGSQNQSQVEPAVADGSLQRSAIALLFASCVPRR